ncbi:MAG: SufD family Fe-S cluster assembly protein, partial [Candidatus Limnocylindrales bacterium]
MSVAPLNLAFATEADAIEISKRLGEPAWLLDERVAAARAVATLPAESNQLFTPYLDLRTVKFGAIEPYAFGDVVHGADSPTLLPAGASAIIHVSEDGVAAHVLSAEATAAGVVVDTFANVLATRPGLLQPVIEGGRSLPADDAFAQVARAVAAVGVLIHVPAGVSLDAPIVLRWGVGAGGRGLISRSVISLGEGAHAKVLEEQVDSGVGDTSAVDRHSLWWGTTEIDLAQGSTLDFASEQDFGPGTVAFVNRHATLGRDAALRWAMASVGGAFFKSRIDNRLVGRGSSVHQVEIGFGGGTQLFDLTSYTTHLGEDTTGDLLSKGVFLDRARGYFKGLITITREAKGTDSFLGEFAMLLARKARSVAVPSLEIDQPNVR